MRPIGQLWDQQVPGPPDGKKELHSEIWGKGVCDMWEKWVSGWSGCLDPHERRARRKVHTAEERRLEQDELLVESTGGIRSYYEYTT